MKNIGVKGFDANMKCRGFQYKQGETYEINEKPNLCGNGFHYCYSINDVFKFYPNNNKNKFFYVEILGDIDKGFDKCCTNKIKILEPFSFDKERLPIETLAKFSASGFVIGGSIALRIHGHKINRPITEVDLIISKSKYDTIKDEVYEKVFSHMKEINRFSGMDSVKCYSGLMGEKYDIIIQEDVEYVTRKWRGYEIKVQDENKIWEHKLKYAINGSMKHAEDIRLNQINFQVSQRPKHVHPFVESDIPF